MLELFPNPAPTLDIFLKGSLSRVEYYGGSCADLFKHKISELHTGSQVPQLFFLAR
jgi:hypothetical protein